MNINNATPLEKATLAWWRSHRPCSFDETEHLKNPTINLTSESEKQLARSVARALKTRGSGQPQKAIGWEVGMPSRKAHGKKTHSGQPCHPTPYERRWTASMGTGKLV